MNSSVRCHSNIDFVLHGESNTDFMTLATPNVQKRGVFVDACWSVSPLCGFSLSLFCNYKAASSRGCGTVTEPRHPPEQPQHAYGLIEQTLLSLHCVSSQKSTVVLLCTCGMWSRIDDHCDRLVMLEVLEASGLLNLTCAHGQTVSCNTHACASDPEHTCEFCRALVLSVNSFQGGFCDPPGQVPMLLSRSRC